MWFYLGLHQEILGYNADENMYGTSDWIYISPVTINLDSLYNEQGIARYKIEGGKIVERTAAEIQEDLPPIEEPEPSINDILNALLGGE